MASTRRSTGTSKSAAKAPKGSTSYRGAAGMRRMQEEQKLAEQRKEAAKATNGAPFRFYVPVGETREIIIVDDEPDFFRNEHNLKNPRSGRFDLFVPCIDEHANCPACAVSDKPGYFAMYLTIVDLTPYTTRNDEEVEFSKKLLVVKLTQQKKITRLLEQHGTLRGMKLAMTRDGDKDAAIGNDIDFIELIDEEELEEYIYDYEDKDGKVIEIDCSVPYDYEEIFPDMSEKQIAAVVGGKGLDEEDKPRRSSSRRGRDDDEEEEAPRRRGSSRRDEGEEEEAPRRRGSSRSRKDEEEEEPAPRRSSRRSSREEPEEEEEEAPRRPARTASKRTAEAAAPRRSSRAAEEEEEKPRRRAATRRPAEEEEDEPAPKSSKGVDRATRRAGLRAGR